MIARAAFIRRSAGFAVLVVLAASCGGSKSPTGPAPPPTPAPAPTPTATPPQAAGCPLGLGSGRFTCQGDVPGLLPVVEGAIDKLVKDQPSLFDLNNPPADRSFFIHDVDAFYDGVFANLVAQGLCAQRDAEDKDHIVVKDSNSYDETYDIVTTQHFIRRGPKTYLRTCTPAHFPLTADQAVISVSVSFFRYTECANTSPPHNTLPLGCRGTITATPRDALGNKLPVDLHGSEITWFVQYGEGVTISTSPAPDGVLFNLVLIGKDLGEFSVCATVSGKTGCLNGTVIP
jgi:hypothetical protein